MYCSRRGNDITLYEPFDGPFDASASGELMVTLEEFLMPTAAQEVGTIQVVTQDQRDAPGVAWRDIDIIDLDSLESESGAITKLSEVEVASSVTSLTD